MGEGAGIVILEELEHAKKRGARIYAEVIGYGLSGDAYHVTAPSEDGSGGYPRHAHGASSAPSLTSRTSTTSTPMAPRRRSATRSSSAPLSVCLGRTRTSSACRRPSRRSAISSGAAGAVEAIFSILAIRDQVAPPTLNLDNPSDGCDIDLVPHKAKPRPIKYALSNSVRLRRNQRVTRILWASLAEQPRDRAQSPSRARAPRRYAGSSGSSRSWSCSSSLAVGAAAYGWHLFVKDGPLAEARQIVKCREGANHRQDRRHAGRERGHREPLRLRQLGARPRHPGAAALGRIPLPEAASAPRTR